MSEQIIVNNKKGVFCISIDDIVYMEKDLRKIFVHIKKDEKADCLEFYGKFDDIVSKLDDRFLCCHRSYIINMECIVWMTNKCIYMSNNRSISLGRDTFLQARKIFTKYLNLKKPENNFKPQKWL